MPPSDDAPENSRRPRAVLAVHWALMALACAVALGPVAWRALNRTPRRDHSGGANAYSVTDGRGKQLLVQGSPHRIVSLSPGTTEMLFAIGVGRRVVADTTYCDYPPAAKSLPKIGDSNTSTEKVIAMRPDLVVADAVANRRAIESLERLHVPVFAVTQSDLKTTFASLMLLGQVTNSSRNSGDLIGSLAGQSEMIRSLIKQDPRRPRVLDIVQMEPLMVVGRGNFMDDLILRAGGINIAQNAGVGWVPYSPEQVVALRPDVILTDKGYVALVRSRAGWDHVPAVQHGAVYALRSEASRPGPRLVEALNEIAHILHPGVVPAPR